METWGLLPVEPYILLTICFRLNAWVVEGQPMHMLGLNFLFILTISFGIAKIYKKLLNNKFFINYF